MEIEYMQTGSASSLDQIPAEAVIHSIDGKECIGRCEHCKAPILAGDKHYHHADSGNFCGNCIELFK